MLRLLSAMLMHLEFNLRQCSSVSVLTESLLNKHDTFSANWTYWMSKHAVICFLISWAIRVKKCVEQCYCLNTQITTFCLRQKIMNCKALTQMYFQLWCIHCTIPKLKSASEHQPKLDRSLLKAAQLLVKLLSRPSGTRTCIEIWFHTMYVRDTACTHVAQHQMKQFPISTSLQAPILIQQSAYIHMICAIAVHCAGSPLIDYSKPLRNDA